ncbi:hypothetical protein E2562_000402 [Oryza meyeriana var. granulata]|uniref:Uncharacterized protein n=1 Tax=Oryza meyeriana var. granulata TaxID=110450 RepID=A0A6G1CD33_9ORYZ|nr:hypothetical protein E2562_000402 [Oryza meyeriana var. granulata]
MEHKQELNMKQKTFKEEEAMASSSSSSFFTHPSSLLRHVVDGCVSYLPALCRSLHNLKTAAPSAVLKQDQADDDDELAINTAASSSQEEPVDVQNLQTRTRAMAPPQRPLLREGNGGKGGSHHSAGF